MIEEERRRGTPVLALDSGGMFLKNLGDADNRALIELTARTFVEALGRMRYDAAAVGATDLLLPGDLLPALARNAPFPFLAANVRDAAGRAPFAPSVRRDFGPLRVGLFGLAGSQPIAGFTAPGGGARLRADDPFAAARRAVADLRADCQLVIALTSLGLEEDTRLAREVPGIDIILGGFTRSLMYLPRLEGETFIVQTGAKGMRLGRLEVEFTPGPGRWVERRTAAPGDRKRFSWTVVALEASLADSPPLAALVEEYKEEMRRRNVVAQSLPPPSAPMFVGAAGCLPCHPAQVKEWERSAHARALAALVRKKQDANPDCLRCHVTAFGVAGGYSPGAAGGPDLRNVQCEACHGSGRSHRGPGGIRNRVPAPVCLTCHTEENSPTFAYEPYLRKLAPHAARYFQRRNATPRGPAGAR